MLIEDIQKSIELGEKYKKSSVSENHLKDVEHIYKKISAILPQIAKTFIVANDVKSILQIPTFEIERLKTQLSQLRDEISRLEHDQVIKKLEDISYLKDQSNMKLEQEWSRYRSENHLKNANMIHSLLNVIDDDPRLDELGTLGNEIMSKRIGDMDAVAKVEKYQVISQAIIKDLGMKEEVEEFVMKLSRGDELVLEDISEEIMKWLLSHNISKKIKLCI